MTGNIHTGLGNPSPPIMNNEWSENENINNFLKNMGEEAIDLYFKDLEGFDFQIDDESITIGFEPAYKYDKLKVLHFDKNKDDCYYQTGIAFGYYGSGICSKTKFYRDYKKASKFKNFINKWYPAFVGVVS
jgi:hypothetical protein